MKPTIEEQRKAERVNRLAAMTERELSSYLVQVGAELDDNRMDFRLKANHYEIRDQIRAELDGRRQLVAA